MAVIPVPQPLIDAQLESPQELEGSPAFSIDEVTGARLIKRTYAVRAAVWQKLAYATPDSQFPNARLINENTTSIQGPVMFFERNFAEIPGVRVESREISFTLPGRSGIQTSALTGAVIGWNPYGTVAPQTVPRSARVEYSYRSAPSLSTLPSSLFTVPAQSALRFGQAQVDYSGNVYISVGNVSIPQPSSTVVQIIDGIPTNVTVQNPPIVEPRWQLAGAVGGFFSGQNWVFSVSFARWKGPIWQMEVVTIPTFILP